MLNVWFRVLQNLSNALVSKPETNFADSARETGRAEDGRLRD